MRSKRTSVAVWVLVCAILLGGAVAHSLTQEPGKTRTISRYEAEILVYLLPEAHDMRAQGFDAEAIYDEDGSKGGDFVFRLQAVVPNPDGSTLLGHFAVNKVTGQILERAPDQQVVSKELEGVLKVMRRAHQGAGH
jgi:hypothetical protein